MYICKKKIHLEFRNWVIFIGAYFGNVKGYRGDLAHVIDVDLVVREAFVVETN